MSLGFDVADALEKDDASKDVTLSRDAALKASFGILRLLNESARAAVKASSNLWMTERVGNDVRTSVIEDGASMSFPPVITVLESSPFDTKFLAFDTAGLGRVLMEIDIVR